MDSKQIRDLIEAYSQVHAPQEVDEAVKGASAHDTEMRQAAAVERKSGVKNRLSPSAGKANAEKMERDIKFYDKVTKKTKPSVVGMTHEEVEEVDEATNDPIDVDFKIQRLPNNKTPKPTPQHSAAIAAALKLRARAKAPKKVDEGLIQARKNKELDIFDVVLEFLQTEGYAETLEEAEWMMANVINGEAIDIILGEAQHARENPEKYERDQEKRTSKREKAMNDPHKGINSPAFAEFMRKQMGR